ncbi:putative protamine P1 [Cooperia oncophora]
MLAPIITKDMKLFPTRPLPAGIKNVRSRAQSLDQFNQVQNSGSARGRIVPVKPRSSQSTGNLPATAAAAATSTTVTGIGSGSSSVSASSASESPFTSSRSPPKTSIHRKTTLTAIQEGVEMGHSHHHAHRVRHTESLSDSKLPSDVPRRNSKKSRKKTSSDENVMKNGHCENRRESSGDGGGSDDVPVGKKEKKGVVKWLTSAFRRSKDKETSSDNSSCNSS